MNNYGKWKQEDQLRNNVFSGLKCATPLVSWTLSVSPWPNFLLATFFPFLLLSFFLHTHITLPHTLYNAIKFLRRIFIYALKYPASCHCHYTQDNTNNLEKEERG